MGAVVELSTFTSAVIRKYPGPEIPLGIVKAAPLNVPSGSVIRIRLDPESETTSISEFVAPPVEELPVVRGTPMGGLGASKSSRVDSRGLAAQPRFAENTPKNVISDAVA